MFSFRKPYKLYLLRSSHCFPVYPSAHSHLKLFPSLIQNPPLLQGPEAQGIAESK